MGVLNEYMNKNKDVMKMFIKKIATVPDMPDANAKKKESLLDKVPFVCLSVFVETSLTKMPCLSF